METDLWSWLTDATVFAKRNQCGVGWDTALETTHRAADLAIFFAYLAIPAFLLAFLCARQRLKHDVPRSAWTFAGFGSSFVLTCGLTHFLSWLMFVHPMYRLDAVVKVLCAVSSWATVAVLPILILQALNIPSARELTVANSEMQTEVAARREAERELRATNRDQREQLTLARTILAHANTESKTVEDGLRDLIRRMEATESGIHRTE